MTGCLDYDGIYPHTIALDTKVELIKAKPLKSDYQVIQTLIKRCKDHTKMTYDKSSFHLSYGERYFWNILTALRSLDYSEKEISYLPDLKDLTTSRIRAILGFEQGLAKGYLCNSEPLTLVQVKRRDKYLATLLEVQDSTHFTHHFVDALFALQELGYDVPKQEQVSKYFSLKLRDNFKMGIYKDDKSN